MLVFQHFKTAISLSQGVYLRPDSLLINSVSSGVNLSIITLCLLRPWRVRSAYQRIPTVWQKRSSSPSLSSRLETLACRWLQAVMSAQVSLHCGKNSCIEEGLGRGGLVLSWDGCSARGSYEDRTTCWLAEVLATFFLCSHAKRQCDVCWSYYVFVVSIASCPSAKGKPNKSGTWWGIWRVSRDPVTLWEQMVWMWRVRGRTPAVFYDFF